MHKLFKNIIIDNLTVFEMNNMNAVFGAITARHPYQARNEKQFKQWLDEYLFERGVKVWKGPVYTFYYKEDDHVYNKYIETCIELDGDSRNAVPKEEFFRRYLEERHRQTVEAEKQ